MKGKNPKKKNEKRDKKKNEKQSMFELYISSNYVWGW